MRYSQKKIQFREEIINGKKVIVQIIPEGMSGRKNKKDVKEENKIILTRYEEDNVDDYINDEEDDITEITKYIEIDRCIDTNNDEY